MEIFVTTASLASRLRPDRFPMDLLISQRIKISEVSNSDHFATIKSSEVKPAILIFRTRTVSTQHPDDEGPDGPQIPIQVSGNRAEPKG